MDLIEDIIKIKSQNVPVAKCILEISKKENMTFSPKDFEKYESSMEIQDIIKKSLNEQIYKLFPYSSPKFNSQDALAEIKKSIKIIDTRLSNSAELDKSIKNLESGVSKLNWNEFKKLSYDYISELD